jgi:hypothetical protein
MIRLMLSPRRGRSAGPSDSGWFPLNAAMVWRGPINKESLMSKMITTGRRIAFSRQSARCYYCKLPMWLGHPGSFPARYGLTPKEANFLQCTAEHLVARSDGGSDNPSNVVAACAHCNRKRHSRRKPLEPEALKRLVDRRIGQGRWHVATLHSKLASVAAPSKGRGKRFRTKIVRVD